jgi:hypothetical protein
VLFYNLNQESKKDNYPIPSMEQILQLIFGSKMFSLLYGFPNYNQILVAESNQLKTTIHTKWGTYTYQKIPFGIINTSVMLQCSMDIKFKGLISPSVLDYLDDATIYSKKRSDHLHHLNHVFERC